MKGFVLSVALVAALVVGVTAAVVASDDEPEITAAATRGDGVASDVATNTGNDALDSGAREREDVPGTGDSQPELEPKLDEPVQPIEPTRDSVLTDLRDFVEGRSEELGEALVVLTERHNAGADVSADLADLVDQITIFGEAVITGVAVTPEALAAVPDLKDIHQSLITGIDGLYYVAATLDASSDSDTWNATTADVRDALGSVAGIIE